MRRLAGLGLSLVVVGIAAGVGSFITMPEIGAWYSSLAKPALNPPAWVFGPVWTTLYICMAVAAWRVWERSEGPLRRGAMKLYAAQLLVNVLWSFVFFGGHALSASVLGIGALLILVVLTAMQFYRIDRAAGALLAPYILWVAFASYLDIAITLLNR